MKAESLSKLGLFLITGIWGSGFVVIKVALDSGILPYAMLGIRFIPAFAILFLFLMGAKIKIKRDEIKLGLVAGCFLFGAFALQTVGLVYTTASKNGFITGANVVFVPFIAWFMTRKKPPLLTYFTSFLCFLGVGVLSLEGDLTMNYGDFLTLLGAIFFAQHMVTVGAGMKDNNPYVVNCFQMLSAGILAVLANFILEGATLISSRFTPLQTGAMVYLVLLNTLLCYAIQTVAQKYVEPSKVSLILAFEMVFGSLLGTAILGDPLTGKTFLGGGLIFLSILIAEGVFSTRRKKSKI